MRTRATAAHGYTLVEVLLALFLVSIGILSAAPMFVYVMRGNAAGADLAAANTMAAERMEQLRGTDFGSLPPGGSLDMNVAGYSDTTDAHFQVRWRISDAASPVGARKIEVRVVPLRQASRRAVTLATLRSPG